MSFSNQGSIRLKTDSWFYRLFLKCCDFAEFRYSRLNLCVLMQGFSRTFLKALYYGFIGVALLCLVAGMGIGAVDLYLRELPLHDGNTVTAAAAAFGKLAMFAITLLAWIAGTIVACLAMILLSVHLPSSRKEAIFQEDHPPSDSIFKIAGQWIYDRMHGICRDVELV